MKLNVGSTLCFVKTTVLLASNIKLRYTLTLDRIEHRYQTTKKYKFNSPSITPTCTCHCPNLLGRGQCSDTDKCLYSHNSSCVNWKEYTDAVSSCGLTLPSENIGQVCCKIDIAKVQDEEFEAFYLSKAQSTILVATVAVYLHESNDILIEPYTIKFSRSGAAMLDKMHLYLQLTQFSKEEVVKEGWYFSSVKSKDVLLSTDDFNSDTDYLVEKLGWLKSTGNYGYREQYEDFIKSFSVDVKNCDADLVETKFGGTIGAPKGQNIKDVNKEAILDAYRDSEDLVVITTKNAHASFNIEIDDGLDHFLYSEVESRLDNFTASVLLDKNGNRFVDVIVMNGSGLIVGEVVDGKETEQFTIFIPKLTHETLRQHPIVTLCTEATKEISLCLYPMWRKPQSICQNLSCTEEGPENPDEVDDNIEYVIGKKDSIWSAKSWRKYLNPLKWFDGIDGATEGVIMVVGIIFFILLLVLIGVVFRFFRLVYNIVTCYQCCCFKRRVHQRARSTESNIISVGSDEVPYPDRCITKTV